MIQIIKDIITKLLDLLKLMEASDKPRPNIKEGNQKLVYIPWAIQTKTKIKTQGKYKDNYPTGCVIHFNAGGYKDDNAALNCVEYLSTTDAKNKKYPYPCIVIARSGNVYQSFPISEWGWHSGTNDHYNKLGIEILNPGMLTKEGDKFKTYYKTYVTETPVVFSKKNENIDEGYYLQASKEQQESLINLLLWLKYNNQEVFSFDNIVGHDEICPNNKNDPGAVIPWTMKAFREYLKNEYAIQYKK
jgi:N-acetyl-anhydromuramyl-L-alanine amidase AmpD